MLASKALLCLYKISNILIRGVLIKLQNISLAWSYYLRCLSSSICSLEWQAAPALYANWGTTFLLPRVTSFDDVTLPLLENVYTKTLHDSLPRYKLRELITKEFECECQISSIPRLYRRELWTNYNVPFSESNFSMATGALLVIILLSKYKPYFPYYLGNPSGYESGQLIGSFCLKLSIC
jgi:hypothetical protein